jgi:hypothetical protein
LKWLRLRSKATVAVAPPEAPPDAPPDVGVREPRRPLNPLPSLSVALPLPDDAALDWPDAVGR